MSALFPSAAALRAEKRRLREAECDREDAERRQAEAVQHDERRLHVALLVDAIESYVGAKIDYERSYREHGGDMGSATVDELTRAREEMHDRLAEVIK